jgi:predicted dehydrogenase
MTRIGIVGAGFMAETHAAAYDGLPDVELAAVASPNSAADFASDHGVAESYATVDELVAEADVDAVDVCSPTFTHDEAVRTALDADLDVFCEKPLSNTLEGAEALADAARDADRTVMVGHVVRFFPQYEQIREEVERGAVGDVGVARARRLSPFPEWGDWFADEDASGGVLLDLAIHDLDYLRWTLGDVERVFARHSAQGLKEHAHVTLRFESGARGYVEASWAQPEGSGLGMELEVAGADGLLEFDFDEATPVSVRTDGADAPSTPDPLGVEPYRRELRAFADAVESGAEPPVTVDDAVEAVRLAAAARRSVRSGAPVDLSEVGA